MSEPKFGDVKNEILQLIQAYENGLSEGELSKTMAKTPALTRMNAINILTNEGKIQLCKRGSELIYRAIDSKAASNLAAFANLNISIEERAVYRVIELSGNKGIWNKDIRTQTKLPLTQLSKVLKNLETRKLIKAVKSVAASKRKVYMLFDVEPDKSVTGGAWYSETEFDSSFVTVLHEQCLKFIRMRLDEANRMQSATTDKQQKRAQQTATTTDSIRDSDPSLVSSTEVKDHIDSSKISNVELSLQDIEMVLETIVFDGLIEKISLPRIDDSEIKMTKLDAQSDEESEDMNEVNYYRALARPATTASVMRIPCGQCPYLNECRPGAVISPDKCQYFDRWFNA